ncbi:hypothetical protein GCM10018787_23150 [Streptomyces thermodiastaticus]|nr:hypothetical protein GCM10018787_23150 [Streptomyces thermodiastaticus]
MLVMATTSERARAGEAWLLSCAAHPAGVQRAWEVEELAPLRSGAHWRVAEARLLPSVQAMKRLRARGLGPVLADVEIDRAWWLLPPDLGDELDDIRQLTVHPAGWILRCPPLHYSLDGRIWLERPDGSGRLTDPVLLGAAFSPGGYHPAEVRA